MNTTRKTQKYGVGGGGWRIEGPGNPRPGTVMEEVMYVQHNSNGPRNIRLMARNEVMQTLKENKHHMYALKKERSMRRPMSVMDDDRPRQRRQSLPPPEKLPSMERIMAGRDVLKASQVTPELLSGLNRLPGNFSQTLDEVLGIEPKGSFENTFTRRKSSAMREEIEKAENAGPASEVRTMSWPRSNNEDSEWMRLFRRMKVVARSRNKEAALSDAAETAFGSNVAKMNMKKVTVIEMKGLALSVVPRQWTSRDMTKISLMACQLKELPINFGSLVPELEKLLLPHNRLEKLPPTFGLLGKLVDLGLTANRFTCIPDLIFDLSNLESLSMTNNKISTIPSSICSCKKLNAIHMTYNPIKRIPMTIGLLEKLRMLTIDWEPTSPNAPKLEHHLPEWAVGASIPLKRDYWKMRLMNRIIRMKQILQANFLKATAAFQKIDADKSGDLDMEELRNGLKWLKADTENFDEIWAWLDRGHRGAIQYSDFMNSAMKDMFDPLYECEKILKESLEQEVIDKKEEAARHVERDRRMSERTNQIVEQNFGLHVNLHEKAHQLHDHVHRLVSSHDKPPSPTSNGITVI